MDYTSDSSIINTKFELFLNNITNNNEIRLQILRACLNLIFTNNLNYQVALYIKLKGIILNFNNKFDVIRILLIIIFLFTFNIYAFINLR
jgi:hypothetical protein